MIKWLLIGCEPIYSDRVSGAAMVPGIEAGNDKTGEAGALARPATEWR